MSLAPLRYALVLLAVLAALAGITLFPGVLRVTGHEVDLIQTLDISYRILDGDKIHQDFMTPLGVLAFLPIMVFLEAGFGPGTSYLMAQLLVAALVLPGIWWVGCSRFVGKLRYAYGIAMVLLAVALIFGAANPAITTSMYYNRWAWILTGFVILVLMIPARDGWRAPILDGVLLGLACAALVLIKVTYVIALAPFALLVVLQDRALLLVLAGVLTLGAALGLATVSLGGMAYWQAYAGDLLAVSGSDVRSFPGVPLADMVASPANLPMTALLVLAVVYWRKVGLDRAGLRLLILAPGLIYITWQNWGNDPKWLFFLALLLLALAPGAGAKPFMGVPAGQFRGILALLALVLYAPSMMNIAMSTPRHMSFPAEGYSPLFRDLAKADIEILTAKSYRPEATVYLDGILPPATGQTDDEDATEDTAVTLNGEVLPDCNLRFGLIGWTYTAVAQLGAFEGAPGRRILVADIYDHLWMFGPFERTGSMAPWYYGTEDGFEGTEMVLVPLCAVSAQARKLKLERMADLGWTLDEVFRTDLFILLKRAD